MDEGKEKGKRKKRHLRGGNHICALGPRYVPLETGAGCPKLHVKAILIFGEISIAEASPLARMHAQVFHAHTCHGGNYLL